MTLLSSTSTVLAISDSSQVGEARRAAAVLTTRLALDETQAGRAALIVTEAATNLHKHAGGGQIVLRPLMEGARRGIEIVAIDKGPGMGDIARCLEDGYSTRGTPGTGLGSIQRLASFLEIYSRPNVATVLLAQVWDGDGTVPEAGVQTGAVSVPVAGEVLCGDAWAMRTHQNRLYVLVVDGLGHGAPAAEAAATALDLFQRDPLRGPADVLQTLHAGMRATRGAAAMALEISLGTGAIVCCGVGNIAGRLLRPEGDRSFVSQNGTMGLQVKRFQEFSYQWDPGVPLLIYSDGLQSRFGMEPYPGLQTRHPGIAAAILQRDFHRERDDSTILVLRRTPLGGRP